MANNFLIAPDFPPEFFGGWHVLNTLLQKRTGLELHLCTPTSHAEEEALVARGEVALIYANPFDATKLIREHGYRAIVKPIGKNDEMVIAAAKDSLIKSLSDLPKGATIAMADNRDVKLIGLRLLEAVDLAEDDLNFWVTDTYQAAARAVMTGQAEVGFFIAEVFHGLSKLTKSQLNVLIESDISTLSHIILVKDDFEQADAIKSVLLSLDNDDDGRAALRELGMTDSFGEMTEEEAEFMIDLMETLLD